MGNNFSCDNYYCQDIILKPEWFSENSWNISYNYFDEIFDFKPYTIEKGLIRLKGTPKFNLLLSKKLNIDLNDFEKFIIPIHFNFFLENDMSIYIILSNNETNLNNIKNIENSDNLFYFHISLNKKKINIHRSYDNKNFKINKIKNNLDNYYNIELKNSGNKLFSINEKMFKNNKEIFDYNSIKLFNNDNIYISLYITSKNQMINKNDYLDLNFE
jgi:hypothetical protein